MRVMAFELAGRTFVLKLEEIEKILKHTDPVPEGARRGDLASLLGLQGAPAADNAEQGFSAVLTGSRGVLRVGAPLGIAEVKAEWILPLPGYMFEDSRVPFSGILEVPEGRGESFPPRYTQRALMLDPGVIMELVADGQK